MANVNEAGQEKTEKPTEKRLSKARDEGQAAKSQEVNFVTGTVAALIYFTLAGPSMLRSMSTKVHQLFLDAPVTELTIASIKMIAFDGITYLLSVVLPFLVVLFVVAIFSNIFQIGFMWTLKPLVPKFDKFNIVKGLKRLFSPRKLVDIPKNFFKLFIIGVAPYYVVKSEFRRLLYIMDSNAWQILAFIGLILMKILFYVSIIMLLLALIDFVYQKWKFDQDLKMTKDEIKDERKQAEGDPKIKARIRRMQMEFVMKRMMTQVPEADVVVTNPIHLAVALKYDRQSMNAPQVVAKGARIIAEKIKEIARENNVPIIENKPLAQSLYKMVEVGDTIPESLYKAVAEILAYVFRQKNNRYAEGQ